MLNKKIHFISYCENIKENLCTMRLVNAVYKPNLILDHTYTVYSCHQVQKVGLTLKVTAVL